MGSGNLTEREAIEAYFNSGFEYHLPAYFVTFKNVNLFSNLFLCFRICFCVFKFVFVFDPCGPP